MLKNNEIIGISRNEDKIILENLDDIKEKFIFKLFLFNKIEMIATITAFH